MSSPFHSQDKHFRHPSRFRRLLDLQRRRRQRRRRQQQQQAPLQDQLLPVAAGGARAGVPRLPLPRRVHEGGHGDQAGSQGGKSGGESDFMKSQLLFPPQSVGDQGQNNNLSIRCTAFKTAMYAHENCRQQIETHSPLPSLCTIRRWRRRCGNNNNNNSLLFFSSPLLWWRACVLCIFGEEKKSIAAFSPFSHWLKKSFSFSPLSPPPPPQSFSFFVVLCVVAAPA